MFSSQDFKDWLTRCKLIPYPFEVIFLLHLYFSHFFRMNTQNHKRSWWWKRQRHLKENFKDTRSRHGMKQKWTSLDTLNDISFYYKNLYRVLTELNKMSQNAPSTSSIEVIHSPKLITIVLVKASWLSNWGKVERSGHLNFADVFGESWISFAIFLTWIEKPMHQT